jgi:oligopeptide transport system substrate-binding protein
MKTFFRTIIVGFTMLLMAMGSAGAEVVYNRGNSADPESLDPHKTSTVYEAHILRDLFQGLVMQDARAELIPGAAESWTVSGDGKVYTFKLRADGVWSNGDPVTAHDFVYSFQRLLNPETAAEYAGMLYPIKGAKEVNDAATKASPDTLGVKAVDDTTLEITLNGPTPYFLEMLTHQASYPVNRKNIEQFGADFIKPGNLVSNGAYTLAEFVPNDHIKIVKNPKFFDAASVGIDVVNYIPTEDRSAALKRYEAGELDSNDDLPTEQLEEIRAKFGDQVRIAPYLGTYYYTFKVDKKPWDDAKLRRAISMAIDRDFLAEKVWKNSMIPAYSFVPPGIAGYEPSVADYADMSQIEREDEAKKILNELGFGPGKPLKMELRFNTSENHQNTAVAVQDMLKPLNVEVSLLNTDTKSHYGMLEQHGDYDVARAGWIADYKDPETFLRLLVTGDGANYALYSNPEFDALMSQAAAEADPAKRSKLLSQAEAIFVRDTPYIPLLFYSFHNIVSPKLQGFEDNVMDVHPTRFIKKSS